MIDSGVKPEELSFLIEQTKEKVLSSTDELSPFLVFASKFPQFSYENLLLLYAQAPEAKNIGAEGAMKLLTERNFEISNQDGPLLILCPVIENNEIRNDVLPVYAFDVAESGSYKLIDAADNISQLEDLIKAFKSVTGKVIYAIDDTRYKCIQEQSGALVLPKGSDEKRINMLVEYYGQNISGVNADKKTRKRAEAIFTYLYYSRYPNAKFLPPLDACVTGEKSVLETSLENAVAQFKRITDRMKKPQVVVYSEGERELEKKQKAQMR